MADYLETVDQWEKTQLAKLAHMLAYWQKQPVEATKEIPENIGAAGRNIGAYTAGFVGDVASIVPGANMAAGGQAPTSEDLLEDFGRKEHWSNLPAAFVAPGPGEVKGILKAMLGLSKEMSGTVGLAQALFHGTPHKFSKFELEKIGTGEGAQAYGHGLYFAESPGVAGSYRDTLAGMNRSYLVDGKKIGQDIDGDPFFERVRASDPEAKAIKHMAEWGDDDAKRLINDWRDSDVDQKWVDKFEAAFEKHKGRVTQDVDMKGHLYEVDIPDETIGKMLDWDAPLSEQPAAVLAAIRSDPYMNKRVAGAIDSFGEKGGRGESIYTMLNDKMMQEGIPAKAAEEASSKWLNEAGIPGIRFYDGSSRSAQKGTRNIVVFNPDDITQVKRDGELVYKAGKKKSLDEIIDIVDKY